MSPQILKDDRDRRRYVPARSLATLDVTGTSWLCSFMESLRNTRMRTTSVDMEHGVYAAIRGGLRIGDVLPRGSAGTTGGLTSTAAAAVSTTYLPALAADLPRPLVRR